MLHVSLITLALFSGTLVGPFPLAQAEPDHHQVMVRAAMAPDGRFAVAWVDSVVNLSVSPDFAEFEMFVRFFEHDGTPLTGALQIAKIADTNRIYWPELAMDSTGNAVLLWVETRNRAGYDAHVRFKLFDRDGAPLGSARTVTNAAIYTHHRTVGLSRNSQGEFAITWVYGMGWIKVQRFAADGAPQGEAFLVHEEFVEDYETGFKYPQVALNDNGDLVTTWLKTGETNRNYPKFQVFDAQDSSILLPWEQEGHRLDDGGPYNGTRPEPHWLDNDRFVVFWANNSTGWLLGRGYSDRGLTPYPMRNLVHDTYEQDSVFVGATWGGLHGWFSTAVSSDDRFAETHTRTYTVLTDTSFEAWYHQAGVLGDFVDNSPGRRTNIFDYSPPYGEDSSGTYFNMWCKPPAVAVCDDRIVWVYSRRGIDGIDTIFKAYALITDWDMGVGVVEQPPVSATRSHWQITTSVGPQIVLRYTNRPEGFHANVFDASGRKVDELHSSQPSGVITWGECYGPGVYFVRTPLEIPTTTHKVILID
jgi:hypothetical protein